MYILIPFIEDKPTSYQLKERGKRFIAANSFPALADFLGMKEETLKSKMEKLAYTQFYIPKPNGEKRRIESPNAALHTLQGQLNKHLQAAYYTVRPDCAYGALIAAADEDQPRNIYTNALQHIGKKWLLNADIRRFFPNITSDMVYQALKSAPFAFNATAAKCLTQLTTHEKRLPTGAPTSPILSNIVCLNLDKKLLELAQEHGWTYTRFIDDLSFSGFQKFTAEQIDAIAKILTSEHFAMNTKKLTISKIKDKPEVTGLILKTSKPDISRKFITALKKNIRLYHRMANEDMTIRQLFPAALVMRFRRFLHGQLHFVKFVRGEGDADYLRLHALLQPRAY